MMSGCWIDWVGKHRWWTMAHFLEGGNPALTMPPWTTACRKPIPAAYQRLECKPDPSQQQVCMICSRRAAYGR